MSKREWGPACWFLFHTLASKVKEDKFEVVKNSLWEQINAICNNLPCHECRQHAIELMRNANKNLILSSKRNLELYLFDFHNLVNKRNNSRVMKIEDYDLLYNKANIYNIISNFMRKFLLSSNNSKLMLDVMHRELLIVKFKKWLSENISNFNQ
jgi:uncharacterized protein (DUF1499 family)